MLCETKTVKCPSDACLRTSGFKFFEALPALGMSGGLWLLCKDAHIKPFSLFVVFKSAQFVACNIHYLVPDLLFTSIFVYAHARAPYMNDFWLEIINHVNILSLPFIILGDFNELSYSSNRLGGPKFNISQLAPINNLLSSLICFELPHSGNQFTWRKKN